MPTIMTHAIVPACLALAAGPKIIPARVAVAGVFLAMLPDADVIGFRFGIPYESDWGHRGASHAIATSLIVACVMTAILRPAKTGAGLAFLFIAMASHGLLDSLTSGGLGPALWWPFSSERIFAPFRPIRVSPFGIEAFMSQRGVAVLISEWWAVWVPMLTIGISGWVFRSFRRQSGQPV
ncbi:MAG: metal-dependent hydrolase [Sphingomonadaceae bacterium]